jgi:hypothetical protein
MNAMRFELICSDNDTYILKDNLFGRSAVYHDYDQAKQLTITLNQQHLAEITALERQFL